MEQEAPVPSFMLCSAVTRGQRKERYYAAGNAGIQLPNHVITLVFADGSLDFVEIREGKFFVIRKALSVELRLQVGEAAQ